MSQHHPYGDYCTCGKLLSIEGDSPVSHDYNDHLRESDGRWSAEELCLLRELEMATRSAICGRGTETTVKLILADLDRHREGK